MQKSEADASLQNMERRMKRVALSEIKDDLSRYLRLAENEEIVITRHGKPAGVLVGFASEDDWFDYRLENDPRFLRRIAQARASLQAGKGVQLEGLRAEARPLPRRTKR
jgi:prevent-host-death family protein